MNINITDSGSKYIPTFKQKITMPYTSMQVFFYICEYLNITPKEFFDAENHNPVIVDELVNDMKVLTNSQLACLACIIKEFKQ